MIFIWLAIVAILKTEPFWAILLTLTAFGVDMLDGFTARKQKTASKFGLQLDTIIDTLNYPIFSALFAYKIIFSESWLGSAAAIIILLFGSLRLSRMAINGIVVDDKKQRYYEGVVTPHILVANIFFFYCAYFFRPILDAVEFLVLAVLSVLMVSTIKTYKPDSLKQVIAFVLLLALVSVYGLTTS